MERQAERRLMANQKTLRQQIMTLLCDAEMSARDISGTVGIREKEVAGHLAHIARTITVQGKTLVVRPFQCLSCGYVFKDRKRYTRPGRCPECKGSHLESPTFRIL